MNKLLRVVAVTVVVLGVILGAAFLFLRRPAVGDPEYRLASRAESDRLRRHVEMLVNSGPRDSDHPEKLSRAAEYIAHALEEAGSRVESQIYDVRGAPYTNVIGSLGPEGEPSIVVGAHYDAFSMFEPLPGADDNASGVAGILELARLLAEVDLPVPVQLVAFTLEEPPYFASPLMGSRVHADELAARGVELRAMICLEMIGFFSEEQSWPSALLGLLYPNRGDFIGVVGRPVDGRLAVEVKRRMRAGGIPVYSFSGPASMGTDASDHRSYWKNGYTAVMVTDTAFLRNPHYHETGDTPETLDYEKMGRVVDGVANAVVGLAETAQEK